MNDFELTEAVAKTFGWSRFKWDSHNELVGMNTSLSDDLHYPIPNYAQDIKAAWQLTKFISFNLFEDWPTPREICIMYLKKGANRA